MLTSNVIGFSEDVPTMTTEQGLAFVARTRRQLDRFDLASPGSNGKRMPPEFEARIREILDDLELDIRRSLGTI